MKSMQIEIITPSKVGYKGNITSLTVPGTNGNFQILYNHAAIISSLEIGEIKLKEQGGSSILFATSGGTIEVSNNSIIILAESIEKNSEIDINRAEESKKRAQERLIKRKEESIDVFRAELSLKKAINRLKSTRKSI